MNAEHATHRARFADAQAQRDASREALILGAISHVAWRMAATVCEVETATAAGLKAMAEGRSPAYAIAIARKHLPTRRNVSTANCFGA